MAATAKTMLNQKTETFPQANPRYLTLTITRGSDSPARRQLITEANPFKQSRCNEISQLPSLQGEAKP
ncbi:hypothetical protein BBI15_14965 [Planococcus plakortidis]|uniref:Uncharacterized protein n=2 Tax=Planococcus TaxID=1372 RepID=A0A1C7ECF4_9BACL|nr:hypothetical protein BBI15_14965 [Planococcus plakortidis]RAZ67310.1 hypothetical protein DP119_11130 [Planococcus maitriensis]